MHVRGPLKRAEPSQPKSAIETNDDSMLFSDLLLPAANLPLKSFPTMLSSKRKTKAPLMEEQDLPSAVQLEAEPLTPPTTPPMISSKKLSTFQTSHQLQEHHACRQWMKANEKDTLKIVTVTVEESCTNHPNESNKRHTAVADTHSSNIGILLQGIVFDKDTLTNHRLATDDSVSVIGTPSSQVAETTENGTPVSTKNVARAWGDIGFTQKNIKQRFL